MRLQILYIVALCLLMWLSACGAPAAPAREPSASAPTRELPTASAIPFTPSATATALPTATASPTKSAIPTLSPSPSPLPSATSVTTGLSSDEQQMLTLVNAERLKAGLPLLTLDATLEAVAQTRSHDMLARGYFSHTDPLSNEPLAKSLLHRLGLDIPYGENLVTSTPYDPRFPAQAMQWLMQDPAHRDNILRPDWTIVGVGIAADTNSVVATQVFGAK